MVHPFWRLVLEFSFCAEQLTGFDMETPHTETVVRPLKGADLEQLLAILKKAFKREIEIGGFDTQRFERNARFYRLMKFLMPVFDIFSKDYSTILVATLGDELVGEVHLNPFGKRMWTIDSLAVDPACGRRGIGFALIEESVDYLAKRKAEKILSSMRTDNIPANKIARKLGYAIFEERVTLIGELDKVPKFHSSDILVREAKSKDTKQIFEIAKTADTVKTQAFETAPTDFAGSLFKTIMDRITGAHSKKFVAEMQGKIVGYAQTIYTSPKEASRIEPFYLPTSSNLSRIANSLLTEISEHLLARKMTKVITSVSTERKETITTLNKLGFTPIANMYWYICLDRKTERQTK
jgi:ribosomal protein S18 acetylase RimI-like enzyme